MIDEDVDSFIETYLTHEELETYFNIFMFSASVSGVVDYVRTLDPVKDRQMLEAVFVMTEVHAARLIAMQKLNGTYKQEDSYRGRR